jgi:hypothetical protein
MNDGLGTSRLSRRGNVSTYGWMDRDQARWAGVITWSQSKQSENAQTKCVRPMAGSGRVCEYRAVICRRPSHYEEKELLCN